MVQDLLRHRLGPQFLLRIIGATLAVSFVDQSSGKADTEVHQRHDVLSIDDSKVSSELRLQLLEQREVRVSSFHQLVQCNINLVIGKRLAYKVHFQ